MNRLVDLDRRNQERIAAYLGGEELNSSPTQRARRWVIDFGDMSEAEAQRWPDLFRIVEEKVKPARRSVAQRDRRELWWLHATRSPELRRFAAQHGRFLALSQVTSHLALAFVADGVVVPHTTVAFLFDSCTAFATLQARPHEVWARFLASSMKDDLRYTPTDCFETFPFPPDWQSNAALEQAGRAYYELRAAVMAKNDQGLTATYNRFHDPDEHDADIHRLRELHDAMDRAVLNAYGWTDLTPRCEFLLDYEDEDEDDDGRAKKRKKPWRWRWPDEVRDEVLARLLALNAERAEEERLAGAEAKLGKGAKKKAAAASGVDADGAKTARRPKKGTAPSGQGGLFG
jgi:hypothetical protein